MDENLMDGLLKEINRAREIKAMYEEIPQGGFGAMLIQREIDAAEKAIAKGDVVDMLYCYGQLKEIK